MQQLIPPWEFPGMKVEVGLADSPEERVACYRLRYEYFCHGDRGEIPQFNPDNYPDRLEYDRFDVFSHQLIAIQVTDAGRAPVGAFRLIPCELGFYIEGSRFGDVAFALPDEFGGVPIRPDRTFEAGRWCGHALQLPGSDQRVLVSMALAHAGLELSRAVGRTHWVCGIKAKAAKGIRADGWPVHKLLDGVSMEWNAPVDAVIVPLGDYNLKCRQLAPR